MSWVDAVRSRLMRLRDTVGGELDAIPPARLRELCETVIRQHLDPVELARLERIEDAERRRLRELAATLAARDDA